MIPLGYIVLIKGEEDNPPVRYTVTDVITDTVTNGIYYELREYIDKEYYYIIVPYKQVEIDYHQTFLERYLCIR